MGQGPLRQAQAAARGEPGLMAGASRRRYTLSYHYFSQRDARNHLELFLDVGEDLPLETWRCFRGEPLKQARRRFAAAPAHRRVYLGFAGNVSGDRGKLRILRKGFFVDRRKQKPAPNSILVSL